MPGFYLFLKNENKDIFRFQISPRHPQVVVGAPYVDLPPLLGPAELAGSGELLYATHSQTKSINTVLVRIIFLYLGGPVDLLEYPVGVVQLLLEDLVLEEGFVPEG